MSIYWLTDKTIKLWKVSEQDRRPEGYNLKDEEGRLKDISTVTSLQVCLRLCHIYLKKVHDLFKNISMIMTSVEIQNPALCVSDLVWFIWNSNTHFVLCLGLNDMLMAVTLLIVNMLMLHYLGIILLLFCLSSTLTLLYIFYNNSSGPGGPSTETHWSDGRGASKAGLCKWPHLPHQFHISEQWWRNVPVSWWP